MKTLIRVVALLSAAPVVALAACEGEPPMGYPQNGTAAIAVGTPGPEAASAAAPAAPVASDSSTPAPSAPASASPAASAEPSAVAAPAAPPAPEVNGGAVAGGAILGSITTKPTPLAAYGVIYLEDGPAEGAPAAPSRVTVINQQMAFRPFTSVVPAGGKVGFANADPFPHNVFSPDNESFNMGNIQQNETRVRVFAKPGAYSLLCNLHPGMLGYLLVTPSAWFARTDANGRFALKNLPNGTYKVTAWAPRQTPITQNVTIRDADVTLSVDLHR